MFIFFFIKVSQVDVKSEPSEEADSSHNIQNSKAQIKAPNEVRIEVNSIYTVFVNLSLFFREEDSELVFAFIVERNVLTQKA